MDIEQLRSERKAEIDAAKAIRDAAKAENRALTEEETAKIDAHLAKAADLQKQIEAARDAQARDERLRAMEAWDEEPAPRATQSPPPAEPPPGQGTQSQPRVTGGEASGRFKTFGEFLFAVRAAEVRGHQGGEIDSRLRMSAAAPGMQESIPSDGGFLVEPDHAQTLLMKSYETGAILSRVQRVPLSSTANGMKIPYVDETSRATGSRFGGVRGYWVDEAGSITDSKAKYGKLELSLHKLACLGYVTEEMLQDYSASEAILMRAFSEELTFMLEDAIINGNGVGKPQGVLTAAALVSQAKESGQSGETINGQNILKMWSRCWARSRGAAVWLHNQDCEPELWALTALGAYAKGATTGSAAIPLVLPSGVGINQSGFPSIFGRPLIAVEQCQTLGTVGDIILADLSQYILIDKGGPAAASSMHVRFLYDEMTYRLTYRVDGQSAWHSALTPFKGSSTVSPFVALATRE